MVQKQINKSLAIGVEGDYADDSARREAGYVVKGTISGGVAASGTIAITTNPEASVSVTVGTTIFTLSPDDASSGTVVKIGTSETETAAALVTAINNYVSNVTASNSEGTITVTAKEVGYEGNFITLATSDSEKITITAMSKGAAGTVYEAMVGRVFSHTADDSIVSVGGENFAGILVNPKEYALYKGIAPTLVVPDGLTGGICSFGHLFVRSLTAYKPNYKAAYDKNTGAISAFKDSAPDGTVEIANAKFIKYSGDAGTIGILELGA